MFEYKFIRSMTEKEEHLIETTIYNINMKPYERFTVYCDTSHPLCTAFIIELVKRVKDNCRGINGCIIHEDRIVFGKEISKK